MFNLEVVLTKRDCNALVREHRYTETVPSLAVATSTADALIARLAVFDDSDYRREAQIHGGSVHLIFWADGDIVGFANINEIR